MTCATCQVIPTLYLPRYNSISKHHHLPSYSLLSTSRKKRKQMNSSSLMNQQMDDALISSSSFGWSNSSQTTTDASLQKVSNGNVCCDSISPKHSFSKSTSLSSVSSRRLWKNSKKQCTSIIPSDYAFRSSTSHMLCLLRPTLEEHKRHKLQQQQQLAVGDGEEVESIIVNDDPIEEEEVIVDDEDDILISSRLLCSIANRKRWQMNELHHDENDWSRIVNWNRCGDDMKDDHGSCNGRSPKRRRKRSMMRVQFTSPVVTKTVIIPNRYSYTKKQKCRIWNSHDRIRRNAKRNRIEYEWEGGIWTNVLEEDQFLPVVIDRESTNENDMNNNNNNNKASKTKWIHPAHHNSSSSSSSSSDDDDPSV